MRAIILSVLFLYGTLCGCSEKSLTPMEARSIADSRYQAHAKALGASSPKLPSPEIQYRETDTVFVYIEPTTKNKITVIVEKSGEFADTEEPR